MTGIHQDHLICFYISGYIYKSACSFCRFP